MKIAVTSDHAGFKLKEYIKGKLTASGHSVTDVGTESEESVDYTDFAHPAACMIKKGEVERGIFFCGSGAGMSITANRHKGIRAVVGYSAEIARLARAHNNVNVLCLAARFIDSEMAWQITQVFLSEPFEEGRHLRRIEKIDENVSCD
jgi:ribose 5-phosphate isomerase B